MPFLEDSGIESEDKPSLLTDERELRCPLRRGAADHMEDLKVTFRDSSSNAAEPELATSSPINLSSDPEDILKPPSTCKILQRKLELKVERAKRNYNQSQATNKKKSQSATLIPISRLPIPGELQQKLLVDYKSESDDCEEISFFSSHRYNGQSKRHAELSDTFSIQEMTIDSDSESNDSPNLELLTPHMKRHCLDYLATCLCFQSS